MFLALGVVCFLLGFAVAFRMLSTRSKNPKTTSSDGRRASGLEAQIESGRAWLAGEKPITEVKRLWTKSEVENEFSMDTWQRLAYEDMKTKILAKDTGLKTFPCVYATMGYRTDDHRYVFLESDNPGEARNVRIVGPALSEYLKVSQQLGPNTSLVIIGQPSTETKTVAQYNDTFWEMLRGLRILDNKPWPKDIPTKVLSEKWTFAYDGEPIFPVMLTPAHSRRWSRQMSIPLIAIQPKWVLDNLLATKEKREAAQNKVRKLIQEYDQIGVSPDLTSYGAPGTSESRQLCLLDDNDSANLPYGNLDEK